MTSLAVSDLLVAVAVMPFAAFHDLSDGHWAFGPVFCQLWVHMDIMCSTASILNLCVISADRYVLLISNPLSYRDWMTRRKTTALISGVWVLSLLVSLVKELFEWLEHSHGPPPETCFLDLTWIYSVLSSLLSFYLPCGLMVVIYARIFLRIRQHNKRSRARLSASQSTEGPRRSKRRKWWVTLGVIIGAFLCCWLPFFIASPIAARCPDCVPVLLFQVFVWLGYFNSCLNPVIYSFCDLTFRASFRRLVCRDRYRQHGVSCVSSTHPFSSTQRMDFTKLRPQQKQQPDQLEQLRYAQQQQEQPQEQSQQQTEQEQQDDQKEQERKDESKELERHDDQKEQKRQDDRKEQNESKEQKRQDDISEHEHHDDISEQEQQDDVSEQEQQDVNHKRGNETTNAATTRNTTNGLSQ